MSVFYMGCTKASMKSNRRVSIPIIASPWLSLLRSWDGKKNGFNAQSLSQIRATYFGTACFLPWTLWIRRPMCGAWAMCSDLIPDAFFELSAAAMLKSTLETLCSLHFNASISDFCLCRVQPGLESRHWLMKRIVYCGEADPSGTLQAHAIYFPDVKGLPEKTLSHL